MDIVLSFARAALVVLPAFGLASPARAAGDAALGKDVFAEQCSECHSVKEGKHKKGPSLFAALGRPAGSLAGFNYSAAMKASGKTWTVEALEAYVTNPKAAVPGGSMKYDGLADAKARADLLAYLATLK
ncbi:c-type cytochrome [Ideonella sp. YS5]|uniref:c-type cytochrome n=1 Tax=Ideonella sp. YS5 TaxID=3453714 RepID=UPI003EE93CE2